jgi:hypothetical protein
MHPERELRTQDLADLAARELWEALYRRLMLDEFPYEARMGWQLAFLRPFAVPRMAATLVDSGQLIHQTRKRAYDTGLVIYELVHGGIESPRGRKMIALMNRAHHGHAIVQEDLTYVLCAFIVTPIRHIELVGWRPVTQAEKKSAVKFFGRMGQLMNIETIPPTYAEAERLYDDYEAAHVAPSEAGRTLGANLIRVLKAMQPLVARPLATPVFALLLNDPAIARAIGITPPPPPISRLARLIMNARAAVISEMKPNNEPIFVPGMVIDDVYPHGYDLDDLGPPTKQSSTTPDS